MYFYVESTQMCKKIVYAETYTEAAGNMAVILDKNNCLGLGDELLVTWGSEASPKFAELLVVVMNSKGRTIAHVDEINKTIPYANFSRLMDTYLKLNPKRAPNFTAHAEVTQTPQAGLFVSVIRWIKSSFEPKPKKENED